MARKLSIRKRGGSYEVGPAGHKAPTASVVASDKQTALAKGKRQLREQGAFEVATLATCRSYARVGMRDGAVVPVVMNTARF